MNPQQFINRIAPIAVELRLSGSTIFPSIRIAQSALETGWKIPSWNNMVGLKVGNGQTNKYWKGKYVTKGTWEVYDGKRTDVKANFRAYDSVEDSFRDQDLLFTIPRYELVRKAKTPEEQANMLYACGYATDPQYAQKILYIIDKYNLKQYDGEVKMIEDLIKKVDILERRQRELETNLLELQGLIAMRDIPEWARPSVAKATKAGVIDTPKGRSYDFYSTVTILDRLNLIEKEKDIS